MAPLHKASDGTWYREGPHSVLLPPAPPYSWLWEGAFVAGVLLTIGIPFCALLSQYLPGFGWASEAFTVKVLLVGIGCLLVRACAFLLGISAVAEEVSGLVEGVLMRREWPGLLSLEQIDALRRRLGLGHDDPSASS